MAKRPASPPSARDASGGQKGAPLGLAAGAPGAEEAGGGVGHHNVAEERELDEAERLLAELEDERQRKQTKSEQKKRRQLDEASRSEAAKELLEGPLGTDASQRLPLRSLTSQKKCAWQWIAGGKITYMIPIGSGTPFSPFSD
mmetsp:Transcript_61184/g.137869  ORF Transcript_61184/g.137869 Transcript_61184/m.137869 type:complete len:143 (-) Transcript_61184:46-474(-)